MVDRKKIYSRDFFLCQRCFKGRNEVNLEIAHRIKQGDKRSKKNYTFNFIRNYVLEKHGIEVSKSQIIEIIDHDYNVVLSCSKCNDYFNIFNKPEERNDLLNKILVNLGYINV